MKRYLSFSLLLLTSYLLPLTYLLASPYPVTINSRVQTAPPLTVYKSTEATFRVTFTEGATPSDVTGAQPFMVWGTNANAAAYSTSSVSVVSSTTGIVDFTFSPASVNYAAGRYVYEVGIQTGNVIRVYRQGLFTIYDSLVGSLARSLYGSGTSVVWQTSINWNLVNWLNLPSFSTEAYVTNRIGAALAPVAASVTNLSLTLSTTTGTVAIIANQVSILTQSVASVQSVLSTNQWIGIDSIPASASRIMVASNIIMTVGNFVDLWRVESFTALRVSGAGLEAINGLLFATGDNSEFAISWTNSYSHIISAMGQVYMNHEFGVAYKSTNLDSPFNPWVAEVAPEPVPTTTLVNFSTTNFIARLASTSNVLEQIQAYIAGAGHATITNDAQAVVNANIGTTILGVQEFDEHMIPAVNPNPHTQYLLAASYSNNNYWAGSAVSNWWASIADNYNLASLNQWTALHPTDINAHLDKVSASSGTATNLGVIGTLTVNGNAVLTNAPALPEGLLTNGVLSAIIGGASYSTSNGYNVIRINSGSVTTLVYDTYGKLMMHIYTNGAVSIGNTLNDFGGGSTPEANALYVKGQIYNSGVMRANSFTKAGNNNYSLDLAGISRITSLRLDSFLTSDANTNQWKLSGLVTNTATLDTTRFINVSINGSTYKLLIGQ